MHGLLLLVLAADVSPLPKQAATLQVKQTSGSGGTMHFAASTTVVADGGTLRLPGQSLPLVDHVVELDGAWLLVGWSSGGGGMQSHDLQVVTKKLEPGPTLSWGSLRAEPCVLLRRDESGWRVGVPYGRREASLRVDGKRINATFVDFELTEQTWSYCPPFQKPMPAPLKVAWFRVSPEGFRSPAE